jgi:N-acetyl sugar amidotransferase
MEKRNVIGLYNLPEEVIFCSRCTMSNQRPRIKFDEHGVCSACRFADYKKATDWGAREKELTQLLDRYRRSDGSYDVIVPSSGGKDSGYIAHLLKHKYGMNPLTVTWAPLIYTDIGKKNFENLIHAGLDNVLGTVNTKVSRILAKLSLIHMADPFQSWIYGLVNFPLRMSVLHKVPLIMYGEYSESEYGGVINLKPTRDIKDHDALAFQNRPVEYWEQFGLSRADLFPYMAPPHGEIVKNGTEVHFLGYYKFWDPQENFYYCAENTGFTANPERSEGTYSKYASLDDKTDGFHYWLGYIKFGIGRATSDSAHEIRDGKITREEGVALVRKYDGEFPKQYYKEFLEFCGITDDVFWKIVDCWRSPHLWTRENGEWKLRHTIA